MILEKTCPMCRLTHLIKVNASALEKHARREGLIQELFPSFNPMEREFVKSGYCPECQSALFGTDFSSTRIEVAV